MVTYKIVPQLRLLVIRVHEAERMAAAPLPDTGDYSVRVASQTDIVRALADDTHVLTPEFVQAALARGDVCVGAFEDNKLVSYGWCSEGPTPMSEELTIKVGEDYMYGYKANTSRKHRGRGLHSAVIRYSGKAVAVSEGKGMVAYVDATNDRSLLSEARAGELKTGLAIIWMGRSSLRVWRSPLCQKVGLTVRRTPHM